jgi:tRNA nucleotidyltransferase/poly(A) polymerase
VALLVTSFKPSKNSVISTTSQQYFTSKTVTLEQDLSRRDLTINAIAQTKNGDLVDPFNQF